jgi:energy-coupling factor transporter ATP-binding protein EcfA2
MLPMDFCRTYPMREREKRALELLELVEMADHAYKLPTALSGGQQQRVAIARALINSPALILADEPTGNLDSHAGKEIMEILQNLHSEGRTIVMITHDAKNAAYAERTIHLKDGRLNGDNNLVYVLMGDGEQQEGQVWEAAMYAAHNKMDHVIATIDYNGQQIDGPVDKILSLLDLKAKWEAFGWTVVEFNGNR